MSLSGLVRSAVVPRTVAIGFVFACFVLMSGCEVKSLNGLDEGLSNDPDMVFDARLVGTTKSIMREHALSRWNLVHGSCKSRA